MAYDESYLIGYKFCFLYFMLKLINGIKMSRNVLQLNIYEIKNTKL